MTIDEYKKAEQELKQQDAVNAFKGLFFFLFLPALLFAIWAVCL